MRKIVEDQLVGQDPDVQIKPLINSIWKELKKKMDYLYTLKYQKRLIVAEKIIGIEEEYRQYQILTDYYVMAKEIQSSIDRTLLFSVGLFLNSA